MLLQIKGLEKTSQSGTKQKNVLNQVDLDLHRGETVGILEFGGCGKSTLAKCITGIERPDHREVLYRGQNISSLHRKGRKHICKTLQIVFQDARTNLNPRRSALEIVQEPLRYLKIGTPKERTEKALLCLNSVGVHEGTLKRYPPQLNTGQCQGTAIAHALVVEPDALICDEAVSALDMILQKQILELLLMLQRSIGFAHIMVPHDIRVARHSYERVAIMDDGFFIDIISTEQPTVKTGSENVCRFLDSALYTKGIS